MVCLHLVLPVLLLVTQCCRGLVAGMAKKMSTAATEARACRELVVLQRERRSAATSVADSAMSVKGRCSGGLEKRRMVGVLLQHLHVLPLAAVPRVL